jgi:hypothetical protein
MKWAEMTPEQKDALVAEKVMGWQWVPAERFAPNAKKGTSWLLPEGGLLAVKSDVGAEWKLIGDGRYMPRYWIPRYTASMDAAWLVVEKMKESDQTLYELFIEALLRFTDALEAGVNILIHFMRNLTPEHICLAALNAVWVEIEI